VKIAYIFNQGRARRVAHISNGNSPREFFYGLPELEGSGHETGYFEVNPNFAPGIIGGLVNILGHNGMAPEKMSGGVLFQVKAILHKLQGYDVIVCTTSGIGFATALWKCLGYALPPVVTIHCGLFNNQYNFFRRWLTSFLLSRMHTILFGEAELPPLLQKFKGAYGKVTVNQFGVDQQFWHPAKKATSDYILSVGNDGRRDFKTLIEAARGIPLEIKILTSRKLPEKLPANITPVKSSWHEETVSDEDLRTLYQHALCVVITLHDSFQPSGQSVALQAMACGCPVVITYTKGLWSDDLMKDNYNVLFVPLYEPRKITRAVERILNDNNLKKRLSENGQLTVATKSNTVKFSENLKELLHNICRENKKI